MSLMGGIISLTQLIPETQRGLLARMGILCVAGVTPFAVGSLLGSAIKIPDDQRFFDLQENNFYKKCFKYIVKFDRALTRQLPPFLTVIIKIKLSFVLDYLITLIKFVEKTNAGERYLSYLAEEFYNKFKSTSWAHQYAEQVEELKLANQETDRHLHDLEGINKKMGQLKERVTPLLAQTQQRVDRAAVQISTEHQRALQIQEKQAQIHNAALEAKALQLRTELDCLLEHQESNFMLAIQMLKELKKARAQLESAQREYKIVQEIKVSITEMLQGFKV